MLIQVNGTISARLTLSEKFQDAVRLEIDSARAETRISAPTEDGVLDGCMV